MHVHVLVTLEISPAIRVLSPASALEEAGREAVANALALVEGNGFSHALSDIASIRVHTVELTHPVGKPA